MLKVRSISELRDYNKVLKDVKKGEPLILTRNEKGAYIITAVEEIAAEEINQEIDKQTYEALFAKWMQALKDGNFFQEADVWDRFGIKDDKEA